MNITPEHIEAVYSMLRAFKPFSGWKLPEADEVGFHVKALNDYGEYWFDKGHHIAISSKLTDSPIALMELTAHEMIHLRQAISGKTSHNEAFRRMARQVCREFLWDAKRFIG